jgi:5-methyltetrahydropteroyltriglutamate--homocysteine methyltransferase
MTMEDLYVPASYRADVVGSLLRPESLRRARADFADGSITRDELAAAEDNAVRQVIDLQRACGLPVVTDGELRRDIYTAPLIAGAEGLENVQGRYRTWYDAQGNEQRLRQPFVVAGKLKVRESVAISEYQFSRTATGLPVKVTVPSPLALVSFWDASLSASAYPHPFDLFADCAEILKEVVSELIGMGCGYIQFDAPELTTVVDPGGRHRLSDIGVSETEFLSMGCDLLNEIAAVRGQDVHFAIHLCRGNNKGRWLRSGGYEHMISTLYERTGNISTFLLEFDDERSGGFEVLQGAPPDKVLVLGLVSTKTGRLESQEDIASRVEEAAKHAPLGQLALSTQCGFSPTAAGAVMDESEQWRKLTLVADVAAGIWKN